MYNVSLLQILAHEPDITQIFKILRQNHLREATLCAGTIRNLVWNRQTKQKIPLITNEIDVYYNDPNQTYEDFLMLQANLKQQHSLYLWNLNNIALPPRHAAHLEFHRTIEKTIADFPETCTSVGIQQISSEDYHIISPYGLTDLFEMRVQPTPNYILGKDKHARFEQRLKNKGWLKEYPQLQVNG